MENRKIKEINGLIYGNTVTNPQIHPSSPSTEKTAEERKIRRLEKENQTRQIKQKNKEKIKVLTGILIVGFMAFSFVTRTGQLYGYQKQYNDLKISAREMGREIEGFRSEIIKGSSIETIVVKAAEMGMISPEMDNFISVDLSRNNFIELESPDDSVNRSIIEKITDSLGLS